MKFPGIKHKASSPASQPTYAKRASVSVLFFNRQGDLLLLKPINSYFWKLVGGGIDPFESPRATAVRETKVELSIAVNNPQFLGVAYKYDSGRHDENFIFYFYGGTLSDAMTKRFVLPATQLQGWRFFPLDEVKSVSPGTEETLTHCLDALKHEKIFYLER